MRVLAQATADESIATQLGDFFTGPKFLVSVGIVVGAVVLYLLIDRVGRRAFVGVGTRRLDQADPVAATERTQRLATLWVALRRVLLIVLLALTALTLLSWWRVPIASFLAVGTVIGVALGFGAQSLVKDVISGFFILSENQFSIGDVVRFGDVAGKVEDIRLRVTVLRDLEGNVHYVPNGWITVTSNLTQEFATVVVDVGVAYATDLDRALAVLGDEIRRYAADPDWRELFLGEPQLLGVEALADSAVVLRVTMQVRPESRWATRREFMRRIKNRLDAENIEIPFPQRTLHPGSPDQWRQALAGSGEPAGGG